MAKRARAVQIPEPEAPPADDPNQPLFSKLDIRVGKAGARLA